MITGHSRQASELCLALSIVDSTGTRFNSLRGCLSKISVADLSFIAWVVDCGDGVHREGHSSDMLQSIDQHFA